MCSNKTTELTSLLLKHCITFGGWCCEGGICEECLNGEQFVDLVKDINNLFEKDEQQGSSHEDVSIKNVILERKVKEQTKHIDYLESIIKDMKNKVRSISDEFKATLLFS